MTQKLIWSYGCVHCQTWHYEGDARYNAHHQFQDKHGSKKVPICYTLIYKFPVTFDKNGRLVYQEKS